MLSSVLLPNDMCACSVVHYIKTITKDHKEITTTIRCQNPAKNTPLSAHMVLCYIVVIL